jgi:PPOX class probable F420-dependent enzyme
VTQGDLVRALGDEQFVDLVSFRSDGTAAHTPVWVSGDGRRLFVSTFGDSWKVRRIERDPRVGLAPCTGHGELLPGASYAAGRAEVVARSEFADGVRAHRAKYGAHFSRMWPFRWPLRLVGKRRVWIVVELDPHLVLPDIEPPDVHPG